jgi:hypothetical protein
MSIIVSAFSLFSFEKTFLQNLYPLVKFYIYHFFQIKDPMRQYINRLSLSRRRLLFSFMLTFL